MSYRIFLLCFTFVAAPALAGKNPARFEITPFVGYRVGGTFDDEESDAEVDLDDASSFGLVLNMQAEANTQYELIYSHQNTDFDPGSLVTGENDPGVSVKYLQIGGTYLFDGKFARPFIGVTIGLAHMDPDDSAFDSDTYFSFAFGGGWKFREGRRFGLRLDGRFYGTVLSSDSSIFCRSGSEGGACLIRTSGDVLWQWEMMAGVSFRF